MNRQREQVSHGAIKATLEGALGRPFRDGDYCSGGRIENFRDGWAKDADPQCSTKVAHHFRRRTDNVALAIARCGYTARVRWLFGEGNYPKCGRCRNSLARKAG